jgi:hypothetical protein
MRLRSSVRRSSGQDIGGIVTDILRQILKRNWASYSHQQLYDMVRTEATGTGCLAGADNAWAEFTALMTDSMRRVDELLRKAGANWEGLAAESARNGVTPLAQWADDAGTAGNASGSAIRQVADSFFYTANAMPEPVKVAVRGNVADVFGGMIDRDNQERQAQQAKLRAVELMQRYSNSVHSAVSSLGVFLPPQEITVRSGPFTFPAGEAGVRRANGAIVTVPTGGSASTEHGQPEARQEPVPAEQESSRSGGAPEARTPSAGTAAARTGPAGGGTVPAAVVGAGEATAAPTAGQPASGGFAGGARVLSGSLDYRLGERLPGGPAPRPGAGLGAGGRSDGGAVRSQGAAVARTGGIGTGPAAARREEDGEHVSPDYLQGYHDDFWGIAPEASPPVIGAEPEAAP